MTKKRIKVRQKKRKANKKTLRDALSLSTTAREHGYGVFAQDVVSYGMRAFHGGEVELPKAGEFLLYLFLSTLERDAIVGDLEEQFPKVQRKFGERAARVWFYNHIWFSLWPLLSQRIVKSGLLGWVFDLLRRFVS